MENKKEKSKVGFWTVFKYFWPHIKKHKVAVLLTILTSATGAVASGVLSPVIYQKIIDIITTSPAPSFSEPLRFWLIVFVFNGVINFIAYRVGSYATNHVESKVMQSLSNFAFRNLVERSRRFFSNNFSGGLVAKAGRFVRSFESIYDQVVSSFWNILISTAGIFFVLFSKNTELGLIFLVWFLIFIGLIVLFARYKIPFDSAKAEADSKTTANLSDTILNVLNIKVFAATAHEYKTYTDFTEKEEKSRIRAWNISTHQMLAMNVLMVSLRMGALYFVILLWAKGQISVGFVVLVQLYSSHLFEQVWTLSFAIRNFGRAVTDAKEMVEIFETPIDIKDPEKPEKCKIKNGNISFENVNFEYKDGKDIFKKFNLEIAAGQKVGFVGHSGSGKTTITNLLLRFEDVQAGAIKIDGQDIRNITQDDLRRNISYVPQEPALFHRSLEENIVYGNPKASKLALLEASKKAHADEFIKEFKDGYETLVGERGVKLSGGQRQRVAIARVMLEDAPILILDEATSSVDSISENLIQEAFDEVMKDRTTLVIAHRLSTVKKMDRIIVLEKGEIVEDGGHDELLAKEGYYFKLWQAQRGGLI